MEPEDFRISTEAQLRELIGSPTPLVVAKKSSKLNKSSRRFLEASSFLCMATYDRDGRCDVSPRGDPKGFVRVLSDTQLWIPERPGNKLADSLLNIIQTGRVGLLFLIAGVGDTFRVNGRAELSRDPELLRGSALEGKTPVLGIVVDIEEAFLQCPKAIIRSGLWRVETFQERSSLPTAGELLKENLGDDFDSQAFDEERAERYRRREGMY